MSIVFVISNPSGSGKSSLIALLLRLVSGLDLSVSYTTRPRRESERDGHEYFFVSGEEFERMVAAGEFIEHANVFGNRYGTARRFLDQARELGRDLLLDVDIQGASQVKEEIANTVTVFVQPPDTHEIGMAASESWSDVEEVIQGRFARATHEMESYCKYDYVLVNQRLEECAEELRKIVLSERERRSG